MWRRALWRAVPVLAFIVHASRATVPAAPETGDRVQRAGMDVAGGARTADLDPYDRSLSIFWNKKNLLPYTNQSICGLPMTTKAKQKRVVAGGLYKIGIKLYNNVAHDFSEVVVKLVLPQGTQYAKGSAQPKWGVSQQPAIEQEGTEVVWRRIGMKAGQKRYFTVKLKILCGTPTPLVFRTYTTVGGIGWITGPAVTVGVRSTKRCQAIPAGPIAVTQNVAALSDNPDPPVGVWTNGRNSYDSTQDIRALPSSRRGLVQGEEAGTGTDTINENRELVASGYPYALRQQTSGVLSRATAGVYYEPHGICNGMLFKDFVLGGFNFAYTFWVDQAPVGFQNKYAPNLRLQVRSPATGEYSDFVWDPAANGGFPYQAWYTSSMTQSTGSNADWPNGPATGTGWGCTLNCFLPANTTAPNPVTTRRSLETYVESLLGYSKCSSAYCAINDAIITGVEIVLGADEPSTVAFTRQVTFTTGPECSYTWIFGAT